MLRLSVVIVSISIYLHPTTRVDNIRNLARRHFAAHGHHFFVGRALLVPVLITLRLPQPRVQHILLHFHALRRLCAHASYQHSKNCDSGWSGGKLDWLHQGMQVPKLSLLSSLTALQLPGSGRLPLVRRDGEAAFRESLCETTVSVLACRRLPGSVLVLLHDMCEDDPRHFSP